MNILHLSRTMGQGGAEKVVVDLCENTKFNFNKIIVLSTGGINVNKLEKNGIYHEIIPDFESKKIKDILITIMTIVRVVRKYNINIIHSHHRMGAFYAQIIRLLNHKIKLVYTAHNVFYNKKLLTRLALSKTEIVAVGEGVKNNLIEFYDLQANLSKVINNSVKFKEDGDIIRPIECEEDKIVISCIGRLSEQKGIEFLIKSIKGLVKRNCDINILVLIIGDGEKKEELISLTQDLSLDRHIKFLGYKSNIHEYMKFSRFIVSSSLWEGFPLTLIECFAQGKTVIASDIVGNNEIIENGYNGILFKAKDIIELTNAIVKLSKDDKLLSYLENNAKKSYDLRFSFKEYIRKYLDVYEGL